MSDKEAIEYADAVEQLRVEIAMQTMPGWQVRKARIQELRDSVAMKLIRGELEEKPIERLQAQGMVKAYDHVLTMDQAVQIAFAELSENTEAQPDEGGDHGVSYEASQ